MTVHESVIVFVFLAESSSQEQSDDLSLEAAAALTFPDVLPLQHHLEAT